MPTIHFATTNPQKLELAKAICTLYGYEIAPVKLEIDEIQGEDPILIVKDKARRAYELFGKPIVVSDDSWDIRALNGFPGPYMKSFNHWFTPDDFLRLMSHYEDRTITLHQYLAYHDGENITVFSHNIPGRVVDQPRGNSTSSTSMQTITLEGENGKTIAEVFAKIDQIFLDRYKTRREVWNEFMDWYTEPSFSSTRQ